METKNLTLIVDNDRQFKPILLAITFIKKVSFSRSISPRWNFFIAWVTIYTVIESSRKNQGS